MRRLIVLILLIFTLVIEGIGLAALPDRCSGSSTEAAVCFQNAASNDPTGSIDPGYDKDVGMTSAIISPEKKMLAVLVSDAYPGYHPQITANIFNCGDVPILLCGVNVETSSPVRVDYRFSDSCRLLPGEAGTCSLTVEIFQEAAELSSYGFELSLSFCQLFTGSPGFWKNFFRSKIFTVEQVEAWLCQIDSSSNFLGPRTTDEMLALMRMKHADARTRFLKHYLALRLNVCAGLPGLEETHDITGIDRNNYLNLNHPENASLKDIIEAIENKHSIPFSKKQYLIMKTICDEINHYRI